MPKIVVLSGAGISAESGVPTFRDADGLWEGHRVEDVATPQAYDAQPTVVHLIGGCSLCVATIYSRPSEPPVRTRRPTAITPWYEWSLVSGFLIVVSNLNC